MTAAIIAWRMRVLTRRGWVRVIVCKQCAALVAESGVHQHEEQHRADAHRGG